MYIPIPKKGAQWKNQAAFLPGFIILPLPDYERILFCYALH